MREWVSSTPGAEDLFVDWVGKGKLDQGVQVRDLPSFSMMRTPSRLSPRKDSPRPSAYLQRTILAITSKLFRRMVEMTEALRKAQLDDIQRVRKSGNSKAKRIVDDLSDSLMHFLELCGTKN